jgi:hypothetical protein
MNHSALSFHFAMGPKQRKDTMPHSPVWIEFGRSDGHPRHLPKFTEHANDRDGLTNYYRIVLDEAGPSIRWRRAVASTVALLMGLPGMFHDFALHRLLMLIHEAADHIC